MRQAKMDSILESLTNVIIGMLVALVAQTIWFPILGKSFTFGENLATVIFFTVISIIRSYSLRRFFNNRPIYKTIKDKLCQLKHRELEIG